MRRLLLVSIVALAGTSMAAQAQLPPVPEPPVTTPTVPLPLPPLPPLPPPPPAPAPTPTLPAPTPTPTLPLPPSPAPTPAPAPAPTTPPVPSVPLAPAPGVSAPAPGVSAPAPGVSAPAQPASPSAVTGSEGVRTTGGPNGGAGSTEGGVGREQTTPKRQRAVTFTFRVPAGGLVQIRLTQVAPVCRDAGRLLFSADRGPNRFRFDGRTRRGPLVDGTYVAKLPSATVRFAIVGGRPTRDRARLDPSVCPAAARLSDDLRSSAAATSTPTPPTRTDEGGGDDERAGGIRPLPRVLGTSLSEAIEAAASLHPAFYVLLALAIAALGAATLPARTLPTAPAGAVLARRRAELTLAGTLGLLTVVVAYWVTLA